MEIPRHFVGRTLAAAGFDPVTAGALRPSRIAAQRESFAAAVRQPI
jgi:hypothetical protein